MAIKKATKKQLIWGVIALVSGFAIAMFIMFIAIYFGYSAAYSAGTDTYAVHILGLKIYELNRVNDSYAGTSVGPNMGILCMVCMALSIGLEQIVIRAKHR